MMKHPHGLFIKNCCLGRFRALIGNVNCCMLTNLIDCSKKFDQPDERGLFHCKTQTSCDQCPTYHAFVASGIPAEEWMEIRAYSVAIRCESMA